MNTALQHKKEQKKCTFVKSNGEICASFAMRKSAFCYMHSPEISDADKRQTRSGGGKKSVIVPVEVIETFRNKPVKLNTPKDVSKFLARIINEVLSGNMDLRLATGIAYITNGLLKSMEISEIEQRINFLEEKIQ
jgi:hypothetical protein